MALEPRFHLYRYFNEIDEFVRYGWRQVGATKKGSATSLRPALVVSTVMSQSDCLRLIRWLESARTGKTLAANSSTGKTDAFRAALVELGMPLLAPGRSPEAPPPKNPRPARVARPPKPKPPSKNQFDPPVPARPISEQQSVPWKHHPHVITREDVFKVPPAIAEKYPELTWGLYRAICDVTPKYRRRKVRFEVVEESTSGPAPTCASALR